VKTGPVRQEELDESKTKKGGRSDEEVRQTGDKEKAVRAVDESMVRYDSPVRWKEVGGAKCCKSKLKNKKKRDKTERIRRQRQGGRLRARTTGSDVIVRIGKKNRRLLLR